MEKCIWQNDHLMGASWCNLTDDVTFLSYDDITMCHIVNLRFGLGFR